VSVASSRSAGAESAAVEIDGRRVALTSLTRVLWPASGFTKKDMIAYYRRVAPALLPHIERRPLTLGRFPAGVEGPGFAQTECRGRPEWLKVREIRIRSGEVRRYCVAGDVASLVWIANQSAIELHTFLSCGSRLDRPAAVAFDLDPGPGAGILDCCRVATWLRDALARISLEAWPKTSGSRGLHVLVPIAGRHTYSETKAFARAMAGKLATDKPARVTDSSRAAREGRVLVDWLQNSRMRTTVAPYSLRSTDLPTVSTPVRWEEVEAALAGRSPEALVFSPDEVVRRIERHGDLFGGTLRDEQSLPRVR
jgi:bifunctional non-homologous end joining protein LigD